VLVAESDVATTRNSNCTVLTGKWFSWYNDKTYTNAYGGTYVQIDHTVPVENSWQSGAWSWTKATRVRFYNDLGDARSLNAVDTYDNEAKGASAPDEWLPRYHRCRYIRYWAAVKTRWSLTVTKSGKAVLLRIASGCPNTTVKVTKASIVYSQPRGTGQPFESVRSPYSRRAPHSVERGQRPSGPLRRCT